jgi:hypothetical protein
MLRFTKYSTRLEGLAASDFFNFPRSVPFTFRLVPSCGVDLIVPQGTVLSQLRISH